MIGESCFNIIKAVIVRCALALHTILTIWRVTENLYDEKYWLLLCLMIPFILEGLYSIIKRQGKEYLWFSPCFFLYLCATLPPIWLLELDKSKQVREEDEGVNLTHHDHPNNTLNELAESIPVSLNPNMWTIVIEEMLLYLLVIGRWILPRGEVTREQLSELLFAFIGIAADVMEFFSLFGENNVRNDEILGYLLLAIWSLSILQFTMAVTVTQQPKRAKKIKTVRARDSEPDEAEDGKLSSELGAIFISMVMQDVPFLALRLYTIITYNLITYSLIFFTSKNVLVISLLFYKIAVLLQMRYCPEVGSSKDGDEEKIVGGFGDFAGEKDEGKKRKNNGGEKSTESSPSKYALPYEYVSVLPTNEKSSALGSPNGSGDSKLSKRAASKTSVASAGTRSIESNGKKGSSQDNRPNGLTLTPADAENMKKSPAHGRSPTRSNKSSAGSIPPGTPKSLNIPSGKENASSPGTPNSLKAPSVKGNTSSPGTPNSLKAPSIKGNTSSPGTPNSLKAPSIKGNTSSPGTPKSINTPSFKENARSPGTPKSPNTSSFKENTSSPGSEHMKELDSPKEFNEPVIISPTQQSAQPGDPDFKPYTSVVKLP